MAAVAFAPQDPPDAQRIADRLSCDDPAIRAEATDQLVDMGEAARPAIEGILETAEPDLEAADRARRILRVLDLKRACPALVGDVAPDLCGDIGLRDWPAAEVHVTRLLVAYDVYDTLRAPSSLDLDLAPALKWAFDRALEAGAPPLVVARLATGVAAAGGSGLLKDRAERMTTWLDQISERAATPLFQLLQSIHPDPKSTKLLWAIRNHAGILKDAQLPAWILLRPEAGDVVRGLLFHASATVRDLAAESLALAACYDAAPDLARAVEIYRNAPSSTLFNAAAALRAEEAAPQLLAFLMRGDPRWASPAAAALRKLGIEDHANALTRMLESASPQTAHAILTTLDEAGVKDAAPGIARWAGRGSSKVRRAALVALLHLDPQSHAKEILDLFDGLLREGYRSALELAFAEEIPCGTALVERMIQTGDGAIQTAALLLAPRYGGADPRAFARSGDPRVRLAAALAAGLGETSALRACPELDALVEAAIEADTGARPSEQEIKDALALLPLHRECCYFDALRRLAETDNGPLEKIRYADDFREQLVHHVSVTLQQMKRHRTPDAVAVQPAVLWKDLLEGRRTADVAMLRTLQEPAAPSMLAWAREGSRAESAPHRKLALQVLAAHDPAAAAERALELSADSDTSVRVEAVQTLDALDHALLLKAQQRLAADSSAFVRLLVASHATGATLMRLTHDSDPGVCAAAARALGSSDDPAARVRLVEMLDSESVAYRTAAAESLATLGAFDAVDDILRSAAAVSGDPGAMIRAAASMLAPGDGMRLKGFFVHKEALTLAAALGGDGVYEALDAKLASRDDVERDLAAAAIRVLDPASAYRLIDRRLTHESAFVRISACDAVAGPANVGLVSSLRARAADPSFRVRRAAIEALIRIDMPASREALQRFANDPSAEIRARVKSVLPPRGG